MAARRFGQQVQVAARASRRLAVQEVLAEDGAFRDVHALTHEQIDNPALLTLKLPLVLSIYFIVFR